MSVTTDRNIVHIEESGHGPYGQFVSIGHHVLGADEPQALGGEDTGPDPFEFVMAGLGACTAMTIRMYASRKNWPLENVQVSVQHVRATGVSSDTRPHAMERRIVLVGPLTDEQRDALIKIAQKCPVGLALEAGIEVLTVEASGVS
ncbi:MULTISPECIES: OsmC family protein [Alphaproteobacteria]|uniref:OsmC family protein n=2 Tax=Alphaproteobacteria TaxID=28211 RepID=A0ABW4SC38_9RHOB|nr:OsmC family protein [Chelatococcus caeni]MBB4020170.1 putative redox protein [Chelatococcus caeni]